MALHQARSLPTYHLVLGLSIDELLTEGIPVTVLARLLNNDLLVIV